MLSLATNAVSIVVCAVQMASALACEPFGMEFESTSAADEHSRPVGV